MSLVADPSGPFGAKATLSEDKGSGRGNLRRRAQSLPMADPGHTAMRFAFTLSGKFPKQVRVTRGRTGTHVSQAIPKRRQLRLLTNLGSLANAAPSL
jgi:hypothetical protein